METAQAYGATAHITGRPQIIYWISARGTIVLCESGPWLITPCVIAGPAMLGSQNVPGEKLFLFLKKIFSTRKMCFAQRSEHNMSFFTSVRSGIPKSNWKREYFYLNILNIQHGVVRN